jgi:hypothetical protein
MAARYGRLRERDERSLAFSNVKVGTIQKLKKSDSSIVSTVPITVSVPVKSGFMQKTWDEKHSGPPYKTGGDFASIKVDLQSAEVRGGGTHSTASNYFDPTFKYRFSGGFTNPDFSGDPVSESRYESLSPFSNEPGMVPDMGKYCAEVFNKLKPKIETASLGVALAEARDIPRMLKTSSKGFHDAWLASGGSGSGVLMKPKNIADHYMNHQFGWKPFVKDMLAFADTYQNSKKYIDDVSRNNNTWVKRVRTIDIQESTNPILVNYSPYGVEPAGLNPSGILPGGNGIADAFMRLKTVNGNSCRGYYRLDEILTTRVWAVGSFKFYRDEFDINSKGSFGYDAFWNKITRQLALYGATVNPSHVWKATPWTWLIDWFSNVGMVIDNFTSIIEDSMVARYMYLMHHQIRELKLTQVHHFHSGDVMSTWSRFSYVKRRQAGPSPYSFCFGWDKLSPIQLSILAALGITRTASR